MFTTRLKISVLIPVHSTQYLRETLDSISGQTIDFEKFIVLLIADRVRSEDIRDIVGDSQFNFMILASTESGIVNALNTGVNSVTTEFIARMDADDIMMPERLESQLAKLESRKNLVGTGSAMILMDENQIDFGKVIYPSNSFLIRKLLPYKNVIGHPTMMMRTSALRQVGGYREIESEDWELWNRLSEVGKITNIKKPLIRYRIHRNQISKKSKKSETELSSIMQLLRLLRINQIEDFPHKNENVVEWKSRVSCHIAMRGTLKKIEKSQRGRTAALRILGGGAGVSRVKKVLRVLSAARHSPLEVGLLIVQRNSRFF